MSPSLNALQQPIGPALPDWSSRRRPERVVLQGRYCRLEPLDVRRHAAQLYAAFSQAQDDSDWTYMAIGPFADLAAYQAHAVRAAASSDPLHFAIVDAVGGQALGTLALMRMDPDNGVIEVGFVSYAPSLKRRPAATEAQYLLMRLAFDELGYRRYEWKCDSLNAPSRAAAVRLGFQFEGVFRQAMVYKGRSRDTAWFSMLDSEWPTVRANLEQWLAADNFDAQGRQRTRLSTQGAA